MKSVKKISLLAICFVAVAAIIGTDIPAAEGSTVCTAEGVWIINVEGGDIWFTLNMPLENSKKSYGMTFQWVTFDATMGGLFPSATITNVQGIAELVEYNLYNYTTLGYGLDTDRSILYIIRGSGTLGFVDCDTIEGSGTMGLYSPDQDPFSDVDPTFGCYPLETTAVRMPNVPPCE